ncbi:MAG: DHH family phosphoesterase [archaeon]
MESPQVKGLGSISSEDLGKTVSASCLITGIRQTKGPTVFTLSDATSTIQAKSFSGKAGDRAHPELAKGMAISATFLVREYNNSLEGELKEYAQLGDDQAKQLESAVKERKASRAEPFSPPFLTKSGILEKMRERFAGAARMIRTAVMDRRPIIVRHHGDADGYCAAVAIERAVIPMICDQHDDKGAGFRLYKRSPSRTPFYSYEDASKDVAFMLDDEVRFGSKRPLVIVTDNGSTDEDLPALEKVHAVDCDIIVLDHHDPGELVEGKVAADSFVKVHINPHLVGGDSSISAGMLCAELARFINDKTEGLVLIAAVAAIADRCEGEERDAIVKLASAEIDEAHLAMRADVLDFETHTLKFIEGRTYMDRLLSPGDEAMDRLVESIFKRLSRRKEQLLADAREYETVAERENYLLVTLDSYGMVSRSDFPTPSKVVSMVRDAVEDETGMPVVALGLGDDIVTFRFSKQLDFDANAIMVSLKGALPHAGIEGGGHARAASMRFHPIARAKVVEKLLSVFSVQNIPAD